MGDDSFMTMSLWVCGADKLFPGKGFMTIEVFWFFF